MTILVLPFLLWSCRSQGYTGHVAEVHQVKSSVLIDLDGRYPNQKMTLYVPGATCRVIHGHWPLVGAKITVTGKIVTYRGRPEIVVEDASQMSW